jgi:pantoate kinase
MSDATDVGDVDGSASAFVPGHVTGFFSVHRRDDPRRAGSRGAGLCLSDGVTVTVTPAEARVVRLNGRRVEIAAVTGVLDELGVGARVECETPLPISAGFGVSGAAALGTALAAPAALDAEPRLESEIVATAHAAEVRAGTGLGDVVGQARGGMPVRLEPGAPPHGRLDGLPARPRIEYVSFGELDTATVIGGDVDQLTEAGEAALTDLRANPTVEAFVGASRRFAREADLLTDPVAEAVEAVTRGGGEAAMVMLGESVFALGDGLSAAGYDARSCRIDGGASLVG